MAHCDEFAVAALAKSSSFVGIGVDIEPALPLPEEIVDHVATEIEKEILTKDPLFSRLLFCAKEATYKAVHPKDKVFLEMHDIFVDLTAKVATTSYGRMVHLAWSIGESILVLAVRR
jgi:4'-phosphopantetheinyl transferase EntD